MSEWINVKDKMPPVMIGEDNSANVLVVLDGKLRIMAYCYIEADQDSGWAWCDCNNDIYGDPEFDDEYHPTHWQPLPSPPKQHTNEKE